MLTNKNGFAAPWRFALGMINYCGLEICCFSARHSAAPTWLFTWDKGATCTVRGKSTAAMGLASTASIPQTNTPWPATTDPNFAEPAG